MIVQYIVYIPIDKEKSIKILFQSPLIQHDIQVMILRHVIY